MANVGVTFDFAAESAKLRSEIDKVRKQVGGLNATVKGVEKGFKFLGGAIAGAVSAGAVTAWVGKINSAMDSLNDKAGRLGAFADGLQALELAAGLAGGSAEAMNVAMTKAQQTIGAALNGNKQAADTFTRLGISAKELAALPIDQAFLRIDSALGKVTNTYQRAAFEQSIYGEGAKNIAGLSGQASAAVDEVNRRLEEQGARLDKLDVAKIGIMNDELQFQSTVVTNLGAKFLSSMTPAVGVAVDTVAELIGQLGGASTAGRAFGIAMVAGAKWAEAAVYAVMEGFNLLVSGIAKMVQFLAGSFSSLLDLAGRAASAVGLDVGMKLQQAGESAANFATNMGRVADVAWARATEAAGNAAGAIVDMFHAGQILDEKTAQFDRQAREAAARKPPGDVASLGGAGSATAAVGAGIGLTDKQIGGAFAQVDALKVADVETDYRLVADRLLYDAKLIAQEEYEKTALGKLDLFNQSWLGSLLYSNELAIAAEEAKNATLGGLMGELVNMGIQQGGALGKFGKAYAIAQTVWSTGTAIMKTMASLPYPANIGAAALVAAKGAMQLANIKKTNIGSSGSIAGTGGGGGSTQSAALRDVPAGTQPSTESQQKSAVQIVIQGNLISNTETARWLGEVLGEAINDRDLVFINSNSRQALELAGA